MEVSPDKLSPKTIVVPIIKLGFCETSRKSFSVSCLTGDLPRVLDIPIPKELRVHGAKLFVYNILPKGKI
jgi:hypothetical protein